MFSPGKCSGLIIISPLDKKILSMTERKDMKSCNNSTHNITIFRIAC